MAGEMANTWIYGDKRVGPTQLCFEPWALLPKNAVSASLSFRLCELLWRIFMALTDIAEVTLKGVGRTSEPCIHSTDIGEQKEELRRLLPRPALPCPALPCPALQLRVYLPFSEICDLGTVQFKAPSCLKPFFRFDA